MNAYGTGPEQRWEWPAPGVGRLRLPRWDATAGLAVGPAGALLIDAGASLREGALLRLAAEQVLRERGGPRRVTHLALTHAHFDHVFGAAAFAGAAVHGAVGLDTALTRTDTLESDAVRHGLGPREAGEAADALVVPRHLVSGEAVVELGGERRALLANLGPGHTPHDLAVLVPGTPDVVFCGDLVEESGEPQAGPDAVPARWPEALDRLLALGGPDAVYVPGHGAVVDAAFVRTQRDELARRFALS
ncbi:MBL fold metallo-hydrolase [Streptomyces albidoflavus]|uniref:MBL fold metallo-hydrolase n=1 Tax=Streptomyces albidoflavus TaxID=1886 RepID=UPI002148EE6C|nr:MBL fold metallo-hydrolase [Streptomyces albidoflavus]MCR0986302.1 MBL fold metallo-hydrolase [Streptomyces albidoflavus]